MSDRICCRSPCILCVIHLFPLSVVQGSAFKDEHFEFYLAPVQVECRTVMHVDMGSGHVPAIAYCSGFVPPDSIGGDDWMARFPFMKFQQDGLPFVINGLRWHSHNCARGHFVTDTGSGVNGECENLNTRGRPAYSIIQRSVVTSRYNTYWKLTRRVCLAQCYQKRRCAR